MKHGVFNRFKYAGAVHALGGPCPSNIKRTGRTLTMIPRIIT